MGAPYEITPPFGRLLTAMVTPFKDDLSIDWDGVERLAAHLESTGHDGIVVNGTTGEAPTTSDDEKIEIIKRVKSATGGRLKIVAGAGNNETSHSIEQAQMAAKAGADGLLVVTPYYNKPPQAGIFAHFTAMADATELPVMLYDIPGRTGVAIETETIVRLAEHPKIVALKDAKGDLASTSWVIQRSGIPVYSGDDILNLMFLSIGGVGFVSVCGHTVGKDLRAMIDHWFRGEIAQAQEIHHRLLPVYAGTFKTQGAILTKAALTLLGLPGGKVRLPLVDATAEQIATLRDDLRAGGVAI
ncbi:MAG: 4-hydroxy-tetrahydrodipicolinate synthase [Candidatus Nanopelagicaceae bacterium]|jgi:4-hydroxy-tetrahydrodipicolinate synthase